MTESRVSWRSPHVGPALRGGTRPSRPTPPAARTPAGADSKGASMPAVKPFHRASLAIDPEAPATKGKLRRAFNRLMEHGIPVW